MSNIEFSMSNVKVKRNKEDGGPVVVFDYAGASGFFVSHRGHRGHREAIGFVFLASILLKASFFRTLRLRSQMLSHFL